MCKIIFHQFNKVKQMDEQVKLMNKVLHQQKYEVEAKLSQGSYGQIFLVVKRDSGKKYVLKALSIQKLQKQKKMHQAFIQSLILRKLSHPGIINLHQTLQTQSYFIQILDYCPYGDVFKLIAKVNNNLVLMKKKTQIMRFYLAQILQALDYLHNKGVFHRDFKPENIVVDQKFCVKIVDFGTAKIHDQDFLLQDEKQAIKDLKLSAHDKQLVGSAHYLSPQALKSQFTDKNDIWAFGVIVYKFFHNSLPFVGANNYQIFKKLLQTQPIIDSSIPLGIKQIIQNCLKKNPLQRPTSKTLKQYQFFKEIKWQSISVGKSPINQQQLSIRTSQLNGRKLTKQAPLQNCQLFNLKLQKKMFFGNYKPRILAIYRKRHILYFAYKYVDTQITKNQLELNMNDYCQKLTKTDFQIRCDDKEYVFKCQQHHNVDKIVEQINAVIREHFKLQ